MTKPIRLQLSRKKGWRLQAASKVANGLDAVNVARPSKWGNPFVVKSVLEAGYRSEYAQTMVVQAHRRWLQGKPNYQKPDCISQRQNVLEDIHSLRGKNLACWCKPGDPCHADTLLEIANADEEKADG